jgi:hypothetical protein
MAPMMVSPDAGVAPDLATRSPDVAQAPDTMMMVTPDAMVVMPPDAAPPPADMMAPPPPDAAPPPAGHRAAARRHGDGGRRCHGGRGRRRARCRRGRGPDAAPDMAPDNAPVMPDAMVLAPDASAAQLVMNPNTADYGTVEVNTASMIDFTVTNAGDAATGSLHDQRHR